MFHLPESRFSAFAAHLLLSATVFLCLALFTYFILLPGFLFYSDGGATILTLIGSIDVVLGPLITLVIYKKTKPSIKFDLTVIALIQVAALIYGLHSLWSVRPLAVFYAQGEYHVTYESTFAEPTFTNTSDNPALNKIKPPTLAISTNGGMSLSTSTFDHVIRTGESYFSQQNLYLNYKESIPRLKADAMLIAEAIDKGIIDGKSKAAKLNPEKYGVFVFQSSLTSGHMIIDMTTGKFFMML